MTSRSPIEAGSASVEFAVVFPLAVVAMLCAVQVSLLVWDQLRVVHAAREGARALSVSNKESDAADAALRASSLVAERTVVEVSPADRPAGTPSRVRVSYRPRVLVPFTAALMPDLTLRASAWMRVERDP